MRHTTSNEVFSRGIWRENPVFVQLMGLCPALAVTNTVANGLAMGIATFAVLVASSFFVSLLKKWIPHAVRISTYVLIIATFVTAVEMIMAAVVPAIHAALGAFVYLIVVNCMILGRQEAFASKQPLGRSVLDGMGTSLGFTLALFLMGSVREVIGAGTFLGVSLFGPSYQPWLVMILPPGGFFTISFVLLGMNWIQQRRAAREEPEMERVRRRPHPVVGAGRAA